MKVIPGKVSFICASTEIGEPLFSHLKLAAYLLNNPMKCLTLNILQRMMVDVKKQNSINKKIRIAIINLGLFVEEITLRHSHKFSHLLTDLLSPITQVYIVQKSMWICY